MASRKHDLLEISASEDEADRGYDSEEHVAESKARSVKRRRTADNQDPFGLESDKDESDLNEEEEEDSRSKGKGRKQAKTQDTDEDENDEDEELDDEYDGGASLDASDDPSSKPKNKLLNSKLDKLTSGKPPKKDKSGVVYLSSLPPYLKPVSTMRVASRLHIYENSKTDTKSSSPLRTC
jgi:ESF2/ABP1 family protein